MRSTLLFLLLIGVPIFSPRTPAQTRDHAIDADLVAFHQHYDPFFRRYFGCPPRATDVEECRPTQGVYDAKQWRASREAAKKLFDLKEGR